ncbi:type II toxin-antitoxin system RelE/ParE family toxin [Mesorhizobium sp. IMUNJ 23232]|uniref:type II toxin-antitoxin system RelE/ParE family toxin n=1 Tax=Mesorhizobium sp. IMUNJ 23232 TaxID=3376064 RepID=UPI00379F73B2
MRRPSEAHLDSGAKHELGEIVSHIWRNNPLMAQWIGGRIQTTASYLKSQPFIGRQGATAGTREVEPHTSCRIVYQIADEAVFILSVVDTDRLWPPVLDSED